MPQKGPIDFWPSLSIYKVDARSLNASQSHQIVLHTNVKEVLNIMIINVADPRYGAFSALLSGVYACVEEL